MPKTLDVLLTVFIFYLLVVIDFGVNKTLTPIYDLTFDTSAWPVPSVVGGSGSTGLTETNGMPKSRTLLSNPCNAA